MHEGEVLASATLVRRLVAEQFPQWAGLPVRRLPSDGTVHALFRIGDEMLARFPRMDWGADEADRDAMWLPRLAPHLPVAVPEVLAIGRSGLGFPWRWGIYRWLEGEHPAVVVGDSGTHGDPGSLASELAGLVRALQAVDAVGAPSAGRGRPLVDAQVRDPLTTLAGQVAAGLEDVDTRGLAAAWARALAAPQWSGPPVWVHGDLMASNLLLRDGRLAAVIDWGGLGVGDPACDLIPAWAILPAGARETFRSLLGVDDATWQRGRGWAIAFAVNALPYYRVTNPAISRVARHTIAQVLAAD